MATPDHLLEPADYSLSEAMSLIVPLIPDRIAVDSGDEQITYAELHGQASRIARALLDRGLDPALPVFVLCDHGVLPPPMIFGVLYAGLAAALADVREPPDRLGRTFEQSRAQLVICDRAHEELARELGADVLVPGATVHYPTEPPMVEVSHEQIGTILFTSGSTGTPKGVSRAHRDIVVRGLRNSAERPRPGDRTALTSSWGFTASQASMFASLLHGATIHTYDLRTRGARGLPEWIRDNQITTMLLAPSVLRVFAPTTAPRTLSCVRRLTFMSETVTWSDIVAARPLFGPDTVLVNNLSSTEAGVIASYEIPPDAQPDESPVPSGMPIAGAELVIVDEDDEPVPQGEAGRIVVVRSGPSVRGYWQDGSLTEAHFVELPDGRHGTRTSDRGRIRPDGLLEHLGRLDSRVKVRGVMVATSEVELALVALEGIAEAAVIVVTNEAGDTRLVAYVVAEPGEPLSSWKVRREVATRVPAAMVPSSYVAMERLPRTVRHKLDRAALPPPPPPTSTKPYRAPEGNDADLAAIFADVLGVERVGLDDDFFEMGGDSLGVVELLAGIADRFSVDIPASTILEAPTVTQLALRLSHRRPRDASPVVALQTDRAGATFFCVTGGGAPAISMRALGEAMPDHNLFAIQPRGLEERTRPDHSVEAAAKRNILAMRVVQPNGPYSLGGYSFGGIVAFEMACQVRAAGEAVALLVILDTTAPLRHVSVATRVRARAATFRNNAPTSRARRAVVMAQRAGIFGVKSLYAHAERRVSLTSAGLLPRRGYRQYDLFLRLSGRMMVAYLPSGSFDGTALVVRGSASAGRSPDAVPREYEGIEAVVPDVRGRRDLGWSTLVKGSVSVVDVPSDHLGILRAPAVEKVGQVIGDALR